MRSAGIVGGGARPPPLPRPPPGCAALMPGAGGGRGRAPAVGGYVILLNGQPAAGGSAIELEVANQGRLYADNQQGQWWEWKGSGWAGASDPTPSAPPLPPPSTISPDGSILMAGSGGNLVTSAGNWTFGTTPAVGGY